MLAIKRVTCYETRMEIDEEQKIRAACLHYLEREDQGRIERLSKLADVNKQTITKAGRTNQPVQWTKLKQIREGLRQLGYYPDTAPAPKVVEDGAQYVAAPPVTHLLVTKLQGIQGELLAEYLTPAQKSQALLDFVESLSRSLQTYVAALENSDDKVN